ncbi:MAG: hypothetical protein KAW14_10275 [Candidatus Aegiribacteria sp.]|nr:hypothetical protein [Candidatus Aegiribacteria sp.]
MNNIVITYRFRLADDTLESFHIELDALNLQMIGNVPETLPEWINLEFHKCPNCPLRSDVHPYCPLALNLVNIVKRFDRVISYDDIYLDVITKQRHISQKTTAQHGLSSLLGLVIATSGCPHTVFFKPMARFHLSLSNREETAYRVTSMYLLAQYFMKKEGKQADFSLQGLKQIYENVQQVNRAVVERLRAASEADSVLNAIVILDTYAQTIPCMIEDSLDNIRYLFSPYLTDNDSSAGNP